MRISARDAAEIEEAIRKFRRAIESLNSEGRARLREAFEAVQGHFTRLFTTGSSVAARRSFTWWRRMIRWNRAGDHCKAAGQKAAASFAASGGEQALDRHRALIFAVFLTNPAPICVLDEVDAPLDDSNVERLCALLHDIAGETGTRFLVITHNPISMAEMDRLFGVTHGGARREPAVSLISAQAERLAEAG